MTMHGSSGAVATESVGHCGSPFPSRAVFTAIALAFLTAVPGIARADEGGVSFWAPGTYGSLAAVPQQEPGWSATTIFYHYALSAGADVARAREFDIGGIPANVTANVNANLNVNLNLEWLSVGYAFATPVFGGQASFSLLDLVGNNTTSLAGLLTGTVTGPGGTTSFSRFDAIDSSLTGFSDLIPTFAIRWNAGVNNFMTYITGGIPIGSYQSNRLANLGTGFWSVDVGGGYTYFDQKAGHEFSAVLGFTYNAINPATQYQSGVDMHLDWGASQFLTKQWQVGIVGYVYQEIGCDSGSGDRVGCFQSRVLGVGPQVGYIFPINDKWQGYLNLKGYGEFDNANRPAGWNVWLTFNLSPTATPPTSSRPMFTK